MNILARKLTTHLFFSPPSLPKRLIYLHPITVLQQCNSYATRTPRTTTKGLQISKPEIQKSPKSSPSLIKEAQTTVWPKPTEIPFQAKAANFVNLIGYVKIPVQFESDSGGKHFAATVISLGGGWGRKPLLIPVVFEGDLAHIVACHVKENDYVFVSGQLSVEPLKLVVNENVGKFHVVAENLNFVQGFQKSGFSKIEDVVNCDQNSTLVEFPAKELEIFENGILGEVSVKGGMSISSKKLEILENGNVGEASRTDGASISSKKLEILENGNVGEVSVKRGMSISSKKKSGDEIWDLWRDLVKNPQQWWDYRQHKVNGLVKEKYPDFKQKESGEGLWIGSAPKWVFPGLGNLECDVKDLTKSKQGQFGEFKKQGQVGEFKKQGQVGEFKNGGLEDSWKNLVESPDKWWDNRVNKRNPKGPDFRHKETGEGLWLHGSPSWVLSKLPPI